MAKSPKRSPRSKSAGQRATKDLTARSDRQVKGGRQTSKTDFGSVLGRGLSEAADVAINTQQA